MEWDSHLASVLRDAPQKYWLSAPREWVSFNVTPEGVSDDPKNFLVATGYLPMILFMIAVLPTLVAFLAFVLWILYSIFIRLPMSCALRCCPNSCTGCECCGRVKIPDKNRPAKCRCPLWIRISLFTLGSVASVGALLLFIAYLPKARDTALGATSLATDGANYIDDVTGVAKALATEASAAAAAFAAFAQHAPGNLPPGVVSQIQDASNAAASASSATSSASDGINVEYSIRSTANDAKDIINFYYGQAVTYVSLFCVIVFLSVAIMALTGADTIFDRNPTERKRCCPGRAGDAVAPPEAVAKGDYACNQWYQADCFDCCATTSCTLSSLLTFGTLALGAALLAVSIAVSDVCKQPFDYFDNGVVHVEGIAKFYVRCDNVTAGDVNGYFNTARTDLNPALNLTQYVANITVNTTLHQEATWLSQNVSLVLSGIDDAQTITQCTTIHGFIISGLRLVCVDLVEDFFAFAIAMFIGSFGFMLLSFTSWVHCCPFKESSKCKCCDACRHPGSNEVSAKSDTTLDTSASNPFGCCEGGPEYTELTTLSSDANGRLSGHRD